MRKLLGMILNGHLTKVSHELKSIFILEDGQEVPAYYTEVKKLQ